MSPLYLFCCILSFLILPICKASEFYSLSAEDILGNQVDFDSLRGKVLMIVNIPFECRFTDSIYEDLQGLTDELSGLDTFRILLFMSDEFGGVYQPCDGKQIRKSKKKIAQLPFQVFKKIDVLGTNAHPVFKYLVKESKIKPDNHFYKYLVDHHGNVAEVFQPHVSVVEEAYDTIFKYVETTLNDAMGNMSNMMKELDEEKKGGKKSKKKKRH